VGYRCASFCPALVRLDRVLFGHVMVVSCDVKTCHGKVRYGDSMWGDGTGM
jgi:hypothetical protein